MLHSPRSGTPRVRETMETVGSSPYVFYMEMSF